jgi:hypothetical protein
VGATARPEHAGFLASATDDGATSCLDDAGTDEKALGTEVGIAHAFSVLLEVTDLPDGFAPTFATVWQYSCCRLHEFFDPACIEHFRPGTARGRFEVQVVHEVGQVFAGVVEVNDVQGLMEVGILDRAVVA